MTTFREWMQQVRQLRKKSIEKYDGALNGALSDWAQQNNIYPRKLSEISDPDAFALISKKITELTIYQERNATGHHMYGATLSRYKDYLVWLKNGTDMSAEISLEPTLDNLLIDLSEGNLTQEQFKTLQEQKLAEAFGRSTAAREERLAKAEKKPKSYEIKTKVFDRNPDVVVAVLLRANGQCESCSEPAPFLRRSNQSPYLEVHHRIPLAENGDDTVANAVALCPNCHRQAHYG